MGILGTKQQFEWILENTEDAFLDLVKIKEAFQTKIKDLGQVADLIKNDQIAQKALTNTGMGIK